MAVSAAQKVRGHSIRAKMGVTANAVAPAAEVKLALAHPLETLADQVKGQCRSPLIADANILSMRALALGKMAPMASLARLARPQTVVASVAAQPRLAQQAATVCASVLAKAAHLQTRASL